MSNTSMLSRREMWRLMEKARRNVEATGQHVPLLFVHTGTAINLIALEYLPDETPMKQAYFAVIGQGLRSDGKTVVEAVFLSEAWMVQASKVEESHLQPRQHPDREEVLILAGRNAEGTRSALLMQPFVREQSGIKWLKSMYTTERSESLLDFFFDGP